MDPLLLPLAEAAASAQPHQINALVLTQAAPLTRQMLRKWLGFQVNAAGSDPYHPDAADLYQDILAKVLHALGNHLRRGTLPQMENFRQYVMRIATNACRDYQRQQSPARARFKNFLHHLVQHNPSFALWRQEQETLCGFASWHEGSKSLSATYRLARLTDNPAALPERSDVTQENLSQAVNIVLDYVSGPVVWDEFVTVLAALLNIKDLPADSLDDRTLNWAAQLPDENLRCDSQLEERAVFQRLWQEVCALPPAQRDVFCLSFADHNGEDLFTLLLYAGGLKFEALAQGLGRSVPELQGLWARMPLDTLEVAQLLQATSPQVNKWRFRALEKVRRALAAR